MNQIVQEVNQFYKTLGTVCPKYKNINVTTEDLKDEFILSEVLYDLEDNVYVYEGAEELYDKMQHLVHKKKATYNIGRVLIVIGFLLMLGTAGASDLNNISFNQIITQLAISLCITMFGLMISRYSK